MESFKDEDHKPKHETGDHPCGDEFVGRSELATRLDVHERTIDRRVQDEDLPQPCFSPGGRPRWLWSHVVEFLKKRHERQDALAAKRQGKTECRKG